MTTKRELLSRLGLLEPVRAARITAREGTRRLLHPLREAVMRLPSPRFLAERPTLSSPYREHLIELERDGITRLTDQVPAHTLTELNRAFAEFVRRLDAGGRATSFHAGDITVTEEYRDPDTGIYSSNEPFTFTRALLEVCLKPELTSLINSYLAKQAYITQAIAVRIKPQAETGFGSFQWHHDAWGKRINMMIILTEVGEGDQYMTYAKGSHRLRHPYNKYVNSRYTKEEFAERCAGMEVLRCFAKPGDMYVFDSNGLHSGNRSLGRIRDTFIIHYTRLPRTVWAHTIPPEFLSGFSKQDMEPLRWILREDRRPRPLAPPVNSWVNQLLRVDTWLR